MVIGSNPAFVPLSKYMAKGPAEFECTFSFLHAHKFSPDPSCVDANSFIAKLFERKGLDSTDAATIERVDRDLVAMLLSLSGLRPHP
jgi:hypothetical protein